jgi:hypothetical protein
MLGLDEDWTVMEYYDLKTTGCNLTNKLDKDLCSDSLLCPCIFRQKESLFAGYVEGSCGMRVL